MKCFLCDKTLVCNNHGTLGIKYLTEEEKILKGIRIAEILMLKEDKEYNPKGYNPKRYFTAWGNKTALGIYETVKKIMET